MKNREQTGRERAAQPAAVEMRGIVKRYGRFTALDGIDLSVRPGEVLGFIGPNGAGKTTALRILMGMLRADAGSARVLGLDAWRDAVELHRRIAYVPGDVSLWPNLTGGEVIDLFVRLRRNGPARRREELIERFELDPSKKCRAYSKGNRQKIALIAALASDADLYVFDEPTSGLDPLMEQVFRDCVSEIRGRSRGVLLSSHILSEVERLCDRVSIIRSGKIIESGTLSELRHLTQSCVTVELERPIEKLVERLSEQAGVRQLEAEARRLRFLVDAERLGGVVAELSTYGIENLECVPTTLEQLFMNHYTTRPQ